MHGLSCDRGPWIQPSPRRKQEPPSRVDVLEQVLRNLVVRVVASRVAGEQWLDAGKPEAGTASLRTYGNTTSNANAFAINDTYEHATRSIHTRAMVESTRTPCASARVRGVQGGYQCSDSASMGNASGIP